MQASSFDHAISEFISKVVHFGSTYSLDDMETLYTADQSILFFDGEQESVVRVSRQEMMAEFRSRRDSGEAPLSEEYRVLHVEQQDDLATAVLYRRMSPAAAPAMYELRLRKHLGSWLVAGETVLPWPGTPAGGAFLPPRSKQVMPNYPLER